ncbi:transportin-3 isoform X2 [Phymastichus coffea]|uniref:transportin-3 isoform X2 n=1 Tax=Phymastichus coffea TaxID=108790 RepID=UPI00273B01A4|nr:transportin-3 isoform X2 [Phymastichus coffea]
MNSLPSIETVYQAVFSLYKNPNPSEKERASQYLNDLQKSVYAWKIADEMLHQKKDLESCYFAAQTMRTKIQLSFHELPVESHTSLRDSLLDHISQINKNTNAIIVTQLCLALADLILQMPTWQNPIIDLIQKFGNNPASLWPLLEILTVLAEEVHSRFLRLGTNRRQEIVSHFCSHGNSLLEFLLGCCKKDDIQIYVTVLRCLTSWITIHAITLTASLFTNVIALAFDVLQNDVSGSVLHEAASDTISVTLQTLEEDTLRNRDPNTAEPILPLQQLQKVLFAWILNLEQPYHFSVAHEDMDKSINYCRIFTELAETFLETIVHGSDDGKHHYAIKALDLALVCVGHHDYEVAVITFNLWYRLSEILYQRNSDDLTCVFKPYIERLINALCRHCQMEPDHLGLIEDGCGFAEFRAKVFELIKDVVFVVGSSHCFRQMFSTLTVGIGPQNQAPTWEMTEAALFIMVAVAKNILPEENDVVPKVVEAILNLPENTHVAVKHTSILLLGELCEWINNHPQSLEPTLNFLLNCLSQKGLGSAASNALQSICAACPLHMASHFQGLMQIARCLDNFAIGSDAAINLLQGVAKILSELPKDEIERYMKELCWFQARPLCHLIEERVPIQRGSKADPVMWLDRLSSIFMYTSPQVNDMNDTHPCTAAANEMWPVISSAYALYQEDARIMERCCRCLKFIVRRLEKYSAHLLEPLVKQIIELYAAHKHSCFLYLGSILVDVFGTDMEYVSGLLGMLEAFIGPAFSILQETDGLKNHPDTVDDLFRLCSRFLRTTPVPFLHASMIGNIVDCALMACSLDHRDANASVMKFFYELIHTGRYGENKSDFTIRRQIVQNNILHEKGQLLVWRLIHAIVFSLSTYMLSDVADVLIELSLTNQQLMSEWLRQALHQMQTENTGVSPAATPEQLSEFHSSVVGAENPKQVAHALRYFSRLYR